MRIRNLIAASIAALMAIVACEPETDLGLPSIKIDGDGTMAFEAAGGDQQVKITATRDWMAECDAEWLILSPENGKASLDAQTVVVTAKENKGMDRTADIKFTIGMSSKTLTVTQKGPGGSTEALIVYANDFDKEVATQTYGSGTSWPYLDQFEGWMNEKGTGAANVTYTYAGMSARANSTSSSSYSDYEGSGNNNMFFGKSAYLAVKNIALGSAVNFTLSFGSEKYLKDGNSVFTNSEFHIWLSNDGGAKWVELTDYTFAGGTTEGRWNVATADFTVPSGTSTLSICTQVDVASAYRMDDLKLVISETAGTAVDFTKAVEKDFTAGNSGGNNGGQEPDASAIYHNNFDKAAASEGSNGWPYLDKSDVWKNGAGTGAANVTYKSSGVTVRNNANSDGTYSDYAGSGMNNLFFGKTPYFAVNGIALGSSTNLTLTFGTEKFANSGKVFTNSEFHIWLSNDGGAKWVEFTDYTFAGGTTEGRWNIATANITVPSGTSTLSICMQVDVASAYRIDDLKLVAAQSAGTAVDFTNAVEKDFSTSGNEGDNPGGETPPAEGPEVSTIAEILTAEEDDAVAASGKVMAVTTKGFLLQDATGILYVYTNGVGEVAVGNNVTASGKFDNYFGTLQIGGPATVTANDKATAAPSYPVPTDLTDQAAYDAFKTYSETDPVDYPYVKVKGVLSDGRYIVVGSSTKKSMMYYSSSDYSGNNGKTVTVTGYIVGFHSTNGYYQLVETNVEVDQNSSNDDAGDNPGGDNPGGEVTPPEGGDDPDPSTGSWTKIESVDGLSAGTYYMGGYMTSYSYKSNGETISYDWSDYPYHLCTGVSTDLKTSNYAFADGQLTKAPESADNAVEVILEAVDGKSNTYYVKIGGKYLYSSKFDKRSLASGDTPVEWVASSSSKGGINLTTTLSDGDVILGTAGAASNVLRSYKSPASSLKYGLVFFKQAE